MQEIYIFFVGIFTGLMGTLLGLGGGIFNVPILMFILKMNAHEAIALSLIGIVAKSIFTTSINFKSNFANFPLGLTLIPAAVIGSTIGGRIGLTSSEFVLTIIFALSLLVASVMVFLKRKEMPIEYREGHILNGISMEQGGSTCYTPINIMYGAIISLFAGFFGAMIGVGGGSVLVPVMKVINRIPMKAATSTSVFIMGFSSMLPSFLYYQKGILVPEQALFIIIGSCIGAGIGAKLLYIVNDKHIAKVFSVVLVFIAIIMIYKAFTTI